MLAPVSKLTTAAKRMLLGRPFRSDSLGHTLLPKRIALPVFASDAMSSVAYAPEEIFLVLSVAGISAYMYAPWVGLAVAFVMAVVVASYRQNVHAYPSGGGDYEVATTNLGPTAGLTVGSALLVDYVLTVAVSISSAASNIGSAIPFVATHKVLFAVVAIAVLTAINLRGVRESGTAFAIPTYAFIVGMFVMLGWGMFQIFVLGDDLRAESAGFSLDAEDEHLYGLAFVFLIARSFSSGCAALTGVEAISNGVPAFRKPKSRNAATTLLLLGTIAIVLLMGIIILAQKIGVVYAHDTDHLIGAPDDYHQKTLIAQLAETVFHGFPIGFYFLTVVTALILVLAANTAFNGFPVLGSILAQDRYLPRQLHTRGDRLFRDPRMSAAVSSIALCFFAASGVLFFANFYMQSVRGLTPMEAGIPVRMSVLRNVPESAMPLMDAGIIRNRADAVYLEGLVANPSNAKDLAAAVVVHRAWGLGELTNVASKPGRNASTNAEAVEHAIAHPGLAAAAE
ncbi:APC family permease, partial [Nocardia sp.]|uniref:APC family permease n=1 Tax=Nocardia sp. TaxID=1821 RepID=UPI002588602E